MKLFLFVLLFAATAQAEATQQLCLAEKKNMRCMINKRTWKDGDMRFKGDDTVLFEIYNTDTTCGDRPNGNYILTQKLAENIYIRAEVAWDWVDLGFFKQTKYENLQFELSRSVGLRSNMYSNALSFSDGEVWYRVLCDSPDHWGGQ